MLNLIKNEFSKIFHKASSLVMLIILLLVLIGIPVGSKIIDSLSLIQTYYGSLEDEIYYAQENSDSDPLYLEQLLKAQEYGLTTEDLWGERSWKGQALSTAYNYLNQIYYNGDPDYTITTYSASEIAAMQTWSDDLLKSIENDDWKYYYQVSRDITTSRSDLSDNAKIIITNYYNYLIDEELSPDEYPDTLDNVSTYASNVPYYEELLQLQENGETVDAEELASMERLVLISEYVLKNHTDSMIYESNYAYDVSSKYIYVGNTINCIETGTNAFTIICILFLIVGGTIVSNEFSQGTIKFLLINPITRQKIFWSKYFTMLILALAVTLFSFLLETLISGCVFGFHGLDAPLLLIENGRVLAHSGLLFIFGLYMAQFLQLVICGTIAFMISSLFRNSGLAIAISILIYTVGSTVASLAQALQLDFVRYTIFANLNIPNALAGIFSFEGMTLPFTFTVVGIHMFLFLFIARDAFVRKNV